MSDKKEKLQADQKQLDKLKKLQDKTDNQTIKDSIEKKKDGLKEAFNK